jgi:hypothetical protein
MQIKTEADPDNNTFWVASNMALQRLKLDAQQWDLALPSHDIPNYAGEGLSINGDFAATIIPSHGVAFCKLPGNQWTQLNPSTNLKVIYGLAVAGKSQFWT